MPKLTKNAVLETATARLDLAVQALTGASRAIVRGMFEHGCVSVNGARCAEAGRPGARGDVVEVIYDPEQKYRHAPQSRPRPQFRVAYEDGQVLVVEKAAGVLTVPTEHGGEHSLVDELGRYLSKGARVTRPAFVVHRLDRDTSGVLVFGKTFQAAEALKAQFKGRKPEREYNAIVAGRLNADHGTIESHIATAKSLQQFSTHLPGEGKLAVTHFHVEARLTGATFVRVQLETGRRNQIRVHFADGGHPILGDVRYSPQLATHPLWPADRLALHARTLGFTHPVTGRVIRVSSELPQAFTDFLRATR